ncbi:MAG TPA: TonB-dependent receptor [Vicinamibacterales bacterium]|nr:TonB-dependent receptor [Vicinamibacterales bacterium]
MFSLRHAAGRAVCLLVLMGIPAAAQTTLGTVRGTVFDPQQQVVPGATVVVTDEATGVTREAHTDAQGLFEIPNLRPGTYTVTATLTGFRQARRTGVVLRAASVALIDLGLAIGNLEDVVTVTAGGTNITIESQAIARGLDEQQLRDLPRNSRDIQDFLTLNPNVVGGFDGIQFLGGRTYGASYIQDGQPSSAGIFGELSNAAPGLDAIQEVQVLSNSYSAEYGGLAGVIVSTKRGANRYRATAFYDYNSNELNARTYAQALNNVSRSDPNADTHDYRYGVSLGGPVARNRTFFFANYEGSKLKALGGGAQAIVPTALMRNGDFSANTFVVRDPLTGTQFPGNRIPADRIDPAARRIVDFFYPAPNQPNLAAGGYGAFRQILPLNRDRDRADVRLDHELSGRDSLFGRLSWQRRDPDAFTFESTGGNGGGGLTNLGLLDRQSKATTFAGGWTRIWSGALVSEFRGGYSRDTRNRKSRFVAGALGAQFQLEIPPLAAGAPGFPSFLFSGTNRPSDIRDQRQNTFRDLDQSSLSFSSTSTWLKGRHSMKFGGIFSRNYAKDGYSTGANESKGAYAFSGFATGNAFADFLLGLPNEVREQRNTRGDQPMDTFSNDWAIFAQDDVKLTPRLTLFLGLRYEVIGVFVDKNDIYANFVPTDGGHHMVPNSAIAALLPPGAVRLGRTLTSDQFDVGRGLIRTDRNNISPRLGFAQRLDDSNKTVLRGGFGIFHPTGAAQGARDIMSRNPFRYTIRFSRPRLQQGFSSGTRTESLGFGNQGLQLDLELPDIYQYNLTLERELPGGLGARVSYIGSTMKKLLVHRDYNTVQASAVPLGNVDSDPAARARLPFPIYGTFMDITENRGEGQFNALQLELQRRFSGGLAVNAAYTLAGSDSNAPDSGNSTIGVVQYDPYDIEKDRGPDPNVVKHRVVMNSTWEIPFGRGRAFGSELPRWADAIAGGWTVSTIFQARSGPNLTPYFTYGDTGGIYPANTGRTLDGVGQFGEAWRPDVTGNPNTGGSRTQFYDLTKFTLPAPGTLGNAKKGSVKGPGTWIVNLAFYKNLVRARAVTADFTVLLDNAFNHPQFAVGLGTGGFMDLTDYLINGVAANGNTAVLDADTVGSTEGFSVGRVVRLGLRLRF